MTLFSSEDLAKKKPDKTKSASVPFQCTNLLTIGKANEKPKNMWVPLQPLPLKPLQPLPMAAERTWLFRFMRLFQQPAMP